MIITLPLPPFHDNNTTDNVNNRAKNPDDPPDALEEDPRTNQDPLTSPNHDDKKRERHDPDTHALDEQNQENRSRKEIEKDLYYLIFRPVQKQIQRP